MYSMKAGAVLKCRVRLPWVKEGSGEAQVTTPVTPSHRTAPAC